MAARLMADTLNAVGEQKARRDAKGLDVPEMDFSPVEPAIASPRRKDPADVERCYVRFAAIGDRASWGAERGAAPWPTDLVARISQSHDLSYLDVSQSGATAFDVRRVQLREAAAHRPHLVALAAGISDIRRLEWDSVGVRAHLLHCASVLTQRGAVLISAELAPTPNGPLRWLDRTLRARIAVLNGIYDEIQCTFGSVHLTAAAGSEPGSRTSKIGREAVDRLASRGLPLGTHGAAVPQSGMALGRCDETRP